MNEWIHRKPKPGSVAEKFNEDMNEWIHRKPRPGSLAEQFNQDLNETVERTYAREQKNKEATMADENANRRADEEAAMKQCTGSSCGFSFFNRKAGNRRRRTKKTRRGKSKRRGRKTRGRRR
jgi:hypothetical protein